MATAITYCNISTDLTDVIQEIRNIRAMHLISGPWQLDSGDRYLLRNSGPVEMVFENGRELVPVSEGEDETNISAGEFYYKVSEDTVYLQTYNSSSPELVEIHFGPDWDAMAIRCRAKASEMVEGWLRSVYATPFQKVPDADMSISKRNYDYWIITAVATVTCALIIKRANPADKRHEKLMAEVNTPVFNENIPGGESPGIIQQIRIGEIQLNTQANARRSGGVNVFEQSDNTGTGYCDYWEGSRYRGSSKQIWLIEIDTGGDIDSATFKLSRDDGRSFEKTLQPVRKLASNNNRRINIGSGVEVEFTTDESGSFAVGDKWRLMCYPIEDAQQLQQSGIIEINY